MQALDSIVSLERTSRFASKVIITRIHNRCIYRLAERFAYSSFTLLITLLVIITVANLTTPAILASARNRTFLT